MKLIDTQTTHIFRGSVSENEPLQHHIVVFSMCARHARTPSYIFRMILKLFAHSNSMQCVKKTSSLSTVLELGTTWTPTTTSGVMTLDHGQQFVGPCDTGGLGRRLVGPLRWTIAGSFFRTKVRLFDLERPTKSVLLIRP